MRKTLLAAALLLSFIPAITKAAAPDPVTIRVLSSRADLVSGGTAVVAITIPSSASLSDLQVDVDGRDVTGEFDERPNGKIEALVDGLQLGANTLTAKLPDGTGARITITNHPNGGPVFSGPQLEQWRCEAGAINAKCDKPAVYTYLYRSTDESQRDLLPYDPGNPPSDVATTETDQGVTVPFIVRQEVGYQDRDQYKILTLYQPGKNWDRWAPQKQWNHKVLVTHGGGCGAARSSGTAPIDDFSGTFDGVPLPIENSYEIALSRGFAVMSTALDNNGHNCNLVLQAESLLMAKEHLIKTYGDVRYTIGTGCSGGSITQHQVANAYPGGVYDGLIVTCAYPDSLSTGAQFADFHMLRTYFEDPSKWGAGVVWTPLQWGAVEGRPDPVDAIVADEEFFKSATATTGDCVPKDAYEPSSNPDGVRCGILDAMINVLGPRPSSVWSPMEKKAGRGFAGQPFSNVGLQYGLNALKQGLITPAQFLDLNEKIGGLDIDGTPTAERIVGDDETLANSYRSGAINEANNMDTVAVIDFTGPDPGAAHDTVHAWWMKWRMNREFGTPAGNHVMWVGPEPIVGDIRWAEEALYSMDRWLSAVEKDTSGRPLADKIVQDRPADVHDRCSFSASLPQLPTDSICLPPLAQMRYGSPRAVAGGLAVDDVNKCQLKPLRRDDTWALFSDEEFARLQAIFPTGVCDWSEPAVGQQPTIPWQTYQDANGNVIYGGKPLGPAPVSTPL